MGSAIKNILCLTVITIVAGVGLGFVYDVTKEPIAQMEESTKLKAYQTVFPEATDFGEADQALVASAAANASPEGTCEIEDAVIARDASGSDIGYVINVTTHEGYGGDITISMGVDNAGEVKGIEILKISETAGLGMKATEEKFRNQFANKAVTQFSYTKSGAKSDFEIDALSGATITTKAVVDAVNTGLTFYGAIKGD